MTGAYYIAARAAGSHDEFTRVGRAKRGGRFLWWSTRYARALLAVHQLAGSVDDAGLLAFRAWCHEQHLEPKIDHVTSLRERMRDWMDWAFRNEPAIHYQQSRPMPLAAMKARKPFSSDCSGSTTGCAYAAGVPDPNGRGYDGSGFTGTIRAHLPERQAASQCRVGDPIVYGGGTGSHVVMVYEPGPDPLVFSHGQESGPKPYRHSVELAAHGGVVTYHDLGID